MNIGYRYDYQTDDYEYVPLKEGMYIVLRCSSKWEERKKLSPEAEKVFFPYPDVECPLFVVKITKDGFTAIDGYCNNTWGLSVEDLNGYELIEDWHGIDVDPDYINKYLTGRYDYYK